jgi:APA family basic amino acid/polyamine antiporter
MYYLVRERPLQSLLGIFIMISGLLIYAIFRKRSDAGSATASLDRQSGRE